METARWEGGLEECVINMEWNWNGERDSHLSGISRAERKKEGGVKKHNEIRDFLSFFSFSCFVLFSAWREVFPTCQGFYLN